VLTINMSRLALLWLFGISPAYTVETVQQIYKHVAETFQDQRRPPTLKVVNFKADAPASGAFFDPEKREIEIDGQLVANFLTRPSLGPDAIAFVLSHELGHFYGDHRLALTSGAHDAKYLLRLQILEEQADFAGILHCHLSGYEGARVAADAIRELYSFYHLKSDSPDYLPLEQRIEGVTAVARRIRPLLPVYNLAITLVLQQKLIEASRVFDVLADRFQSSDLLIDAAVLKARVGLARTPSLSRYADLYPFLFATQNNLARSLGAGRGGSQGGEPFLREAERQLRQLLLKSPDSPYVRINMALVLDLLGRPAEGLELLQEQGLFTEETSRFQLAARAILLHHNHRTVLAQQHAWRSGTGSSRLWESFFLGARPPAVPQSTQKDIICPDAEEFSAAGDVQFNRRDPDNILLEKTPSESYPPLLEVFASETMNAARLETDSFSIRVIELEPSKILSARMQRFFDTSPASAHLAGVPIEYHGYQSQGCGLVLGTQDRKLSRLWLVEDR
jgi:hypothetical protein